jgi:hypothetical protein
MIHAGAIHRTRVVAALTLIVSLGFGAAISSATRAPTGNATATSPTEAANESVARPDAESLLAQLALPPGTTPSPSEPGEDDALLSRPGIGPLATPNVVDSHAWWRVPGAPSQVLAYVREHLPAGVTTVMRSDGFTGPGRPQNEVEAFAWPPLANVLSTRWLAVNVVALPSGSTGLRVDAVVVWVTPRPTSEAIPRGAHLLRVSVVHTLGPRRRARRPLAFSSTGRIDRVVALLNELPAAQPGVTSCPSDAGNRVRLAFYDLGGSAPSAIADVDPEGCGTVQLTLAGVSQPTLGGRALPGSRTPPPMPLLSQLERILAVKLDVARRPAATPARPSRKSA